MSADSPAAKGGLRTGDVVTEVAGEKVPDGIALIVAIRVAPAGRHDQVHRQAGQLAA